MTNNYKNKFKYSCRRCMLFIIPFALVIMGVFTGCKKFLDVAPIDKVPQSKLLTDEQGFKDVLNGIYLGMDKPVNGGKNGLYTLDLTMGLISALGYDYDNINTAAVGTDGDFYKNAGQYAYSDAAVRAEIDGIWIGMYSNITNLNNMLPLIDEKKAVFTGDTYNRIKGEAIALRALFHFDLARLFGKPPVTGMNEKAIPYRTQFNVSSTAFSILQVVLDSCIGDLNAARELLAQTDTSAVLKAEEDPFISYTQNHLNYWAVQGLLARIYLYKGDTENAARYARAVMGSNKFPLITSNVAAVGNIPRDRTFSQELLFAVYSSSIKASNLLLFNKSGGTPLTLQAPRRNTIYVSGSGSSTDYRYISWFDNSSATPAISVPSKFFQDANLPYVLQNFVPVIRASEMYYIAAECAINKNDLNTGVAYLNQVRRARGLNALNAAGINSTDSVSNEIMREYQKEFIQEGQTFYYYKRLNKDLKQVTATTSPNTASAYVLPIPDKEKEYNNP
jgi:hypothetical protein